MLPEQILARITIGSRSDALYLIWFCWGLALLLYIAGSAYYKVPIVPLLLIVLMLMLMLEKIKMFGRTRDESEIAEARSRTTVIAQGACFKVEGNLDVYGQFVGTLQLNGGALRVLKGGWIEGDVSAAHVIINGTLNGTCTSSEVEILEDGKMKGLFKGGSLSIRKGGQFVGHSQPQEDHKGLLDKDSIKLLQHEDNKKGVDTYDVVAKQA